jgi:hypothetical protein
MPQSCCTLRPLTCVVTFVWALKKRVPWQGPASVAYLHPLTYVFLGVGFIVYALGTNVLWPRGLLFARDCSSFSSLPLCAIAPAKASQLVSRERWIHEG